MVDARKKLAVYLMREHPGIPQESTAVAEELVEAMMTAMRKFILKENELTIEGVGKLEVKRVKGATAKRDARSGTVRNISDRNVLKITPSENFKKIINIGRKPSKEVKA